MYVSVSLSQHLVEHCHAVTPCRVSLYTHTHTYIYIYICVCVCALKIALSLYYTYVFSIDYALYMCVRARAYWFMHAILHITWYAKLSVCPLRERDMTTVATPFGAPAVRQQAQSMAPSHALETYICDSHFRNHLGPKENDKNVWNSFGTRMHELHLHIWTDMSNDLASESDQASKSTNELHI